MKIQLSSVFQQIGKEQFYEVLPEFNEINGYPIVKKEDIRLCVTPVDSIHFTVSSEGQVELLIPCDRCLKDVNTIVPFSFSYKVDQNKGTDEDGEAVLFLEDNELDTDSLLEGEIGLSLPMKVLCSPECKGVCPVCGTDLNVSTCNCGQGERLTSIAEALIRAENAQKKTKKN